MKRGVARPQSVLFHKRFARKGTGGEAEHYYTLSETGTFRYFGSLGVCVSLTELFYETTSWRIFFLWGRVFSRGGGDCCHLL